MGTDYYCTFEGGYATIRKYYGKSSSLFIKNSFTDAGENGHLVRTIGENAFSGNEYIESLIINNEITSIGKNAFKDCVNLNMAFIPNSVSSIGNDAFFGCSSLTDIYYGGSMDEWDEIFFGFGWDGNLPAGYTLHTSENFDYYLNSDRQALITKYTGTDTNVTVPATLGIFPVYRINEEAFYQNYDVRNVVVSEGIKSAHFYYCGIGFLTLPTTIRGTSLVVSHCPIIEELHIPEGVRELGSYAIDSNDMLRRLYLPSTLEAVYRNAVSNENSLDVYYNGTETEWRRMHRAAYWIDNSTRMYFSIPEGEYSFIRTPEGVVITGCNISEDDLLIYYSKRLEIPSELNNQPVVGIGPDAFCGIERLEEVVIPENVTYIGENAFKGCVNLRKATLPDSLYSINESAFEGCTSLGNINFSENLMYIGDKAFYQNCFEEAVLSDKINYIGTEAFSGNTRLKTVQMDGDISEIKPGTFNGCTSLEYADIPFNVSVIGENAFNGCSNLKLNCGFTMRKLYDDVDVILSDPNDLFERDFILGIFTNSTFSAYDYSLSNGEATLIYADDRYFNGVIPDTVSGYPVTSIGEGAIDDYGYSGSLTLPATLKSIAGNAFVGTRIDKIYFKGTEAQWNAISFGAGWDGYFENGYEVYFVGSFDFTEENGEITITGYNGTNPVVALPSVIFDLPVTAIGAEAFKDNDVITDVNIPGSVKVIDDAAFKNCANLAGVTVSQGVINIGESAFENCGLTSLSLPKSIRTIGRYAFKGCEMLHSISFDGLEEEWNYVVLGADWGDNLTVSFLPLYEYFKIGSNTTLTKYNGYDTDVVIPSVIDEKTITRISSGVFSEGITSIYVPDTVKNVSSGAFDDLTTLESVEFGRGITSIPSAVCENDPSLKEVYIPESVTAISSRAFYNCTALTDIYYGGTSFGWKDITKSSDWNVDEDGLPLNYTVHYGAEHLPRYSVSRPAPEEAAATNLRRHSALRFTATSFDYNSFDIFGFLISRRDSMEAYGFKTLTHKNLVSGEPLYIEAICVDDTHNRVYAEDNSGERTYSILAVVPEDRKDTVFVVRPFLTISGATVYGTARSGSFDDLSV